MSEKKSMSDLHRLSKEDFKQASKTPIIIVLDNVRSMNNVGSVFRTADAFLLQAIYLCGYTPQPPHRDIQKTALGATETVNWQYFDTTLQAIEQLKKEQYEIWSVEQTHNSVALHEFSYVKNKPFALIFGNEVEGVSQQVIEASAGVIEIPQIGSKHSLNISISMGIVSWHFFNNIVLG